MPAARSSTIAPAIGYLCDLARAVDVDRRPGLLQVLARVADPRARRGVRHRLETILRVAVCAVLAGARSYVAIAEWAADADEATRVELGVDGSPPSESTIRRVLQRLDADGFDEHLGVWAQHATTPRAGVRCVAVDGKTLRGSGGTRPARHLLAAFDHATGVVLGQVDVPADTSEISLFPTLLDRLDVSGVVVTADALHTQRSHAQYLAARGGHYVVTVKANQPGLHGQLRSLPWSDVPIGHTTADRAHGRVERRVYKIVTVTAGLVFPHAAQAIQVTRRRRSLSGKKWQTQTVYAVTSLTATQTAPARLAELIRGHWSIEDRLHWVRDVVYDEDHSQIRTGNGPRIMACLRNLAITILRLTGTTNIAAALRHHARQPHRPLQTIKTC